MIIATPKPVPWLPARSGYTMKPTPRSATMNEAVDAG
jgi:hypothetical protein